MTDGKYPVQKGGTITLPEGPGLGISVNFAEFKKRCPYKRAYIPAHLPA